MKTNDPGATSILALRTLATVLALTVGVTACSKPSGGTEPVDASPIAKQAPATPQLPAPFAAVRLGMSRAELEKLFAPEEPIASCEPRLVGAERDIPMQVPGAEKEPHSRCARHLEIGGLTLDEVSSLFKKVEKLGGDSASAQEGLLMAYAQVRGTVRAGAVSEAALIEADSGHSTTTYATVGRAAEDLFGGSVTFVRARKARREVCAVINDSCDDVATDRVRTYVSGGYSLAQIDADAHSRVANGKCRGPYLQNEKKLVMRLAATTGALSGVGLARASRADHQVSAEDAASFAVFSSRSGLDSKMAKLGVLIANAIPDAEAYWKGTVTLDPPKEAKGTWLGAVVWLRDDRVVRAVLNVADDKKLGTLPKTLAEVYGSPGTTRGTITTWSLPNGVTAKLDIGASTGLLVEAAGPAGGEDGGAK